MTPRDWGLDVDRIPANQKPLTKSAEQLLSELRQALAEREQFRLLVDSVVDYAIFMLDAAGRVATWNKGAERLKGYTEAEIIGQPYDLFFTSQDRQHSKPDALLRRAMGEGHVQEEGWRVRKDGSLFWAEATLTPILDDARHLIGFSKVTRDLTERKQVEAAEQLHQERYRHLVESVRDYAIFMLDPTGRILTWNAGAQALKGYSENEAIGQDFSVFYPPEDVAAGKPRRLLDQATREGRVEDEGWRVRKDGTRFWADVVITALRDESGTLTGFAKVTRDLTE
ncbi:MAG TPA: PAS domain-containing protein, partial [Stenomitos sp.]